MIERTIDTQTAALMRALSDAKQTAAPATIRAYETALRALDSWLEGGPLTDETLAGYLRHRRDTEKVSYGTLEVIRAAVRFSAKLAGVGSPDGPETALVLKNARRVSAGRGRGEVAGVRWEQADAAAAAAVAGNEGGTTAGTRDAALLAVMSDAMLRVSEASALEWQDVTREADGSGRLTVRRQNTDKEGEGEKLYLGPATMKRLDAWQEAAGIGTGPLFQRFDKAGKPRGSLSERSIRSIIIARRVADAGIEGRVSGHSLRIGSAQSLVRAGASMAELKQAGRWQSDRTPARYTRAERARSGAVARLRYGDEEAET
ncbi:MAG: tyrosine-type recombinase/integrase [Rhodobacteraceae bacterium]|nr:tyrosine-type recombinase/integrase [Paracoccaceae bacterium]